MSTSVERDKLGNYRWKCRACGASGIPRGNKTAALANSKAHREHCSSGSVAAVDRARRALGRYLDKSPTKQGAIEQFIADCNVYLKYHSLEFEVALFQKGGAPAEIDAPVFAPEHELYVVDDEEISDDDDEDWANFPE